MKWGHNYIYDLNRQAIVSKVYNNTSRALCTMIAFTWTFPLSTRKAIKGHGNVLKSNQIIFIAI